MTLTLDASCFSGEVASVGIKQSQTGGSWWDAPATEVTDNGDGTYSFTFTPDGNNLTYYWVINDTPEGLIDDMQNGATCAPDTDLQAMPVDVGMKAMSRCSMGHAIRHVRTMPNRVL